MVLLVIKKWAKPSVSMYPDSEVCLLGNSQTMTLAPFSAGEYFQVLHAVCAL